MQGPRKKPIEEPSSEGWPVLFWLCWVKIITVHGQDVQMFIDDQQDQIIIIIIIIITVVGESNRSAPQELIMSVGFS